MFKKKVLLVLFALGLLLVACTSDPLISGELWACNTYSFFDVLTTTAPIEVRFTCRRPVFDTVFTIPDDPGLFGQIRAYSTSDRAIGIVLKDGELVQLFRNDLTAATLGIVNLEVAAR